jgi:hypothetical protein
MSFYCISQTFKRVKFSSYLGLQLSHLPPSVPKGSGIASSHYESLDPLACITSFMKVESYSTQTILMQCGKCQRNCHIWIHCKLFRGVCSADVATATGRGPRRSTLVLEQDTQALSSYEWSRRNFSTRYSRPAS